MSSYEYDLHALIIRRALYMPWKAHTTKLVCCEDYQTTRIAAGISRTCVSKHKQSHVLEVSTWLVASQRPGEAPGRLSANGMKHKQVETKHARISASLERPSRALPRS